MKLNRRLKILLILGVFLAVYIGAFHLLVKSVHVTYDYQPGDPPLPQRVMYVSTRSSAMNKFAHVLFYPIIRSYERTGDYAYIHDASDFTDV